MQLTELVTAVSSEPQQMLRAVLRIFHFVGLALGLGAATLLDMLMVRFFLGRAMTRQNYEFFVFFADVVSVGLKLLWVTGIGFLIFYWFNDPVKLGNEKVWAKIVIVAILTINGAFIHRTVIPFLHGQIGTGMFDGVSFWRQIIFVTSGMVSLMSWYGPLVIANLPHLNFQVPMLQILEVYALALLAALGVGHLTLFASRITRFRQAGSRRGTPA